MNYSKTQINRAGDRFIDKKSSLTMQDATDVLQKFRLIHQHPMVLFRHTIERKLTNLNIEALVSQRLKRKPSIINKLKVQSQMQLSRMQDIGGLRIVVDNINQVNLIRNELKKVEKHGNFKFIFANEKDYIETPKESGYRSLHLIYKYEKRVPIENKCRIEIQIRTTLHHSWATAIEVLGTYIRQPLKQSFGNEELLNLFKKISIAFIDLEKNKKINNIDEIQQELNQTSLINKLQGFNIIAEHIQKQGNKKGQYLLITMHFKRGNLEIRQYSKSQFEKANQDYSNIESKYLNNKSVEVVLVSVKNIDDLRKAYPNYFMDTHDFIKNLNKVLKNTKLEIA